MTTPPRFCAHCGSPLTPRSPSTRLATLLPWVITSLAVTLLVIVAFTPGLRRMPTDTGPADLGAATIAASDISALTPDERVDRLFNRVMALASAGKEDSVAFFAPMAVNAFAAIGPLTAHRHYDLGLVLLVSGDLPAARAHADTILAGSRTHLLGLALAMRAANAAGDAAEARQLSSRFTAALAAERAKGLLEYTDHAPDIADAIEEAAGRRPRMVGQPR